MSALAPEARQNSQQPEARLEANPELRVAVVSDAIPGRNGVGTYYQDLISQLEERVGSIRLIAPSPDTPTPHQWFATPMPGDPTQKLFVPRLRKLKQVICNIDPHVVVIPTLGPYAWAGLRLAKRLRIPVCAAHHTNFERLTELYWNNWLGYPCRHFLQAITNNLLRRADAVATMDVESFADARDRGAVRPHMVGTPVGTPFLTEPHQPMSERPERVIFVGRLAQEKGVELILEAAEAVPDMEFLIGGDGPLRQTVESAAKRLKNLEYLGWMDRETVLSAIDRSDVLVLPSAIETFGTVALEALARHRLVLVSRDCGITNWPELAQGIFSIEKHETLADALMRLAALPRSIRESIAQRGWNVVDQFNEATLTGWIQLLTDVAATSAKNTNLQHAGSV